MKSKMIDKCDVALEILKNTTTVHLKKLIEDYLNKIDNTEEFQKSEEFLRFSNCVDYIISENFDIKGWMLYDIPVFYSHCFINLEKEKAFDLAVWDIGEVIPRYLDRDSNEQNAKNIIDAILKYDISDYLITTFKKAKPLQKV